MKDWEPGSLSIFVFISPWLYVYIFEVSLPYGPPVYMAGGKEY
jgi:hypothetical protein